MMLPWAEDVDLLPPLEATVVSVRMLVSSEPIRITFLLAALGTLMLPYSTFAPPPCAVQELAVVALAVTEQTTVGIKYALANEPPPEPDDWATAAVLSSEAIAATTNTRFISRLLRFVIESVRAESISARRANYTVRRRASIDPTADAIRYVALTADPSGCFNP